MTQANALMRLMAPDKDAENPIDKYFRFKNNFPKAWNDEMKKYHVTEEEKKKIEHIYAPSYGCPSIQEDLMVLLMECADFTQKEANEARSIVAKKKMSKIPELKEKIWSRIEHKDFANYIWDTAIKVQLGYAFNRSHSLPYSFVGIQTLVLATKFNPLFWNTACLIVNSGALEDAEIDDDIDTEVEEQDAKNACCKKERSTDYGKIATAIGGITSRGIKVSLVDINKSNLTFEPDIENNQILFGMKGVSKINSSTIEKIVAGRPYSSFKDFMQRCPLNKTIMVSLIKAGAFDNLEIEWANELNIEPRILIMIYYLSIASEPKKKLTLQNFNGLLQKDLVPQELEFQKKIFYFNKYLKNNKVKEYYRFDFTYEKFYNEYFDISKINVIQGADYILQKDWDNIYKAEMDKARDWLKENQEEIIKEFNYLLFLELWEKYATGTMSAWEMQSVCFYYHEHELTKVNKSKYGLSNFFNVPNEEIESFFKRNGKDIPIYKIRRIAGTVIGKKNDKCSISLLTVDGVVNVKFSKEYYALINKQISEVQEDGKKKVIDKSWFARGTMLIVSGYKREDTLVAKTYSKTPGHTLYKIIEINGSDIKITHEREGNKDER